MTKKARGNACIQVASQKQISTRDNKGNMKKLFVLLIAAGSAMAEEAEDPHLYSPNLEELVVTGYQWDTEELRGKLMMGLSGAYLIHEYDKKRNEWRFIRASNEKPKETK